MESDHFGSQIKLHQQKTEVSMVGQGGSMRRNSSICRMVCRGWKVFKKCQTVSINLEVLEGKSGNPKTVTEGHGFAV